MASFSALLSLLCLAVGSQGAAVPSATDAMGMLNSASAQGMGLANSGASMLSGGLAAGQGAAKSVSGRAFREARTFNNNLQDTLGKAMNGGAQLMNNLLQLDAAALIQTGELIRSITSLTGATTEQIVDILKDIVSGGPNKVVEYLQRYLEFIAKQKRTAGDKIVSKTNSFTESMRRNSNAGIDMLENFNNMMGSAHKFTSAMTNPSAAAALTL